MGLDVLLDLAAQVFPESVDPFGQAAQGRLLELPDELRVGSPVFRSPRLQLQTLIIKVVLDELKNKENIPVRAVYPPSI